MGIICLREKGKLHGTNVHVLATGHNNSFLLGLNLIAIKKYIYTELILNSIRITSNQGTTPHHQNSTLNHLKAPTRESPTPTGWYHGHSSKFNNRHTRLITGRADEGLYRSIFIQSLKQHTVMTQKQVTSTCYTGNKISASRRNVLTYKWSKAKHTALLSLCQSNEESVRYLQALYLRCLYGFMGSS